MDEADEASSPNEFVYKIKSVLRETKESRRWLRFIAACELQHHDKLGTLWDEARQLASIFAAIAKNTELRIQREKAEREAKKRRAKPVEAGRVAEL